MLPFGRQGNGHCRTGCPAQGRRCIPIPLNIQIQRTPSLSHATSQPNSQHASRKRQAGQPAGLRQERIDEAQSRSRQEISKGKLIGEIVTSIDRQLIKLHVLKSRPTYRVRRSAQIRSASLLTRYIINQSKLLALLSGCGLSPDEQTTALDRMRARVVL